ncbi:Ger(x)C family spore germination protein [Paenibacillus chitinolyticus]|uniref:Ger(x)C family spore germination protein n=1 Tax=Paenibacillus chitinolyticus TaxID=79263 RepID=UPI002DB5C849|nr:Ger(x)C family spore germination protein [Paenibacillus chitinolyticus]MEC0249268.1 Ger(x)C family spore germination protein [Paenibacillus chitinolyticus]
MRYKLMLFIAALLFPLLLSGCNFKDIDKRIFVISMGIDKLDDRENNLRVSLKLAIPQGNPKEGTEQFDIIVEETKTIADAVRKAKSKVDKELDFGHMKVFLIGESMAHDDIYQIINWGVRRRDVQLITLLAIAKPTALDVQKIKPQSERIPSNALILGLSKSGTESPYIVTEYLFDYQRRLEERGMDPILPIVKAEGDHFRIDQLALMKKHRIGIELTPNETKLYNLLTTKNLKTNLSGKMDGSLYELNLESSRASYKINARPGEEPVLAYVIHIKATLEENESHKKMTRPVLDTIEDATEKEINGQVERFLKRLQKQETDPIGFGLHYMSRRWDNASEWEDWQKIYPKLTFKVNTHVRIHSAGTAH